MLSPSEPQDPRACVENSVGRWTRRHLDRSPGTPSPQDTPGPNPQHNFTRYSRLPGLARCSPNICIAWELSDQCGSAGRAGPHTPGRGGGKPNSGLRSDFLFPAIGRAEAKRKPTMVLIKEYRIVLPFTVEEYQVGQLYSVAEASKKNTGGGDGIEVLKNEPYEKDGEKGQYTHKIYYLQNKVPQFIRMLAPEGALVVHEKAWNAYPYCRTVLTNEYMKKNFFLKIETWHKPDFGMEENVHKLPLEEWREVEVVPINIADRNTISNSDYKSDEDPALFKSVKRERGPLRLNWKEDLMKQYYTYQEHASPCQGLKSPHQGPITPHMCAYKLVTVNFKWWGIQGKVERFILEQEKRLFTNFHRQLFCWMDHWIDMDMSDIRQMETRTQEELQQIRQQDTLRGMSAEDE